MSRNGLDGGLAGAPAAASLGAGHGSPAAHPVLETRHLTKAFGSMFAINDVSIAISPREVVALVGANGAGKSTLLRMIAGALKPDAGEVAYLGGPLRPGDPGEAARKGISAVYQELSLVPGLSAAENLFLGDYPRRRGLIDWKSVRRRATELFDRLGIDVDVVCAAADLSLPEKYLVEIAKAVRHTPRLLILDEPTAALPDHDVLNIFRLIRTLQDQGTAVIFVSHRLDEVIAVTDRFIVLREGRLVAEGKTSDASHDTFVRLMVGPAQGQPSETRAGDRLAAELAAHELADHPGHGPAIAIGTTAVSSANLRSVDFRARPGEIVGLTGLRGSGCSDFCRILAGAQRPTQGSVILDDRPALFRSPVSAVRHGIGYVPAERKTDGLFLDLSVQENISLPSLFKQRRRWIRPAQAKAMAAASVRSLNIRLPEAALRTPVGLLSGGNQQKVVLAKWLAAGVKILILDEPTRGVDIATKLQIYDILREFAARGGTVVVASTELDELFQAASRIVVFHRGAVMADIPRTDFDEHSIVSYSAGRLQENDQ
ncbi:MAG TPA: sugar ABC transporter ATP-binding protein [Streptosporangiaceae bacterium]|jgi:ABC-type sugar transport system ATPase subunit